MVEEEKALEKEVVAETASEIAEELEQEEMEELEQIAKELAEEEKKREEELRKFAEEVTLADIIECIEKISKYIEVSREASRVINNLLAMTGSGQEDEKTALIRALMGKFI